MTAEAAKHPEEITAREDSYTRANAPKPAKSRVKGIHKRARKSVRLRERVRTARKLSDDVVLDAKRSLDAKVTTLRQEAKKLGVSHVALSKRIKSLEEQCGYHPDELDKAIIRAVLRANIADALGRLSDYTGWTRVELLEAVK